MAVQNPKKVKQISAILRPGTAEVVVLQNNTNRTLLGVQISEQLFIKHIQAWGVIYSLDEAVYPISDPRDTSAARQQKQAYFRASPRIGLALRIRPIGEAYSRGLGECCKLDFYGVRPGFLYNILEYIGNDKSVGLAPGWALTARQIDRGFGLLTGDDYISIQGYAIDESEFLQDHNLVVIP